MRTLFFVFASGLFAVSDLQAATVEDFEVKSEKMNRAIKVTVIAPNGYAKGTDKLPVVYLLHGHGDNNRTWLEKVPEIQESADQNNLLLVCPNAQDSWYFDTLEPDFQFETFTSRELVEWVDSHYRTIADRTGRAITGISMGGHGAWYLALRHRNVFGAIGSLGGGLDLRPEKVPDWIVKCITRMGTENAPEKLEPLAVTNLIGDLKDGEFFIYIDVGDSDFFAPCNRLFHEKLITQGVSHIYVERVGVHQWEYWRNEIRPQLRSFGLWFKKNQAREVGSNKTP